MFTCKYCREKEAIKNSHIVPKLIFRWIKNTSLTRCLRATNNINKPIQDGLKYPLLCGDCEMSFSKLEHGLKAFIDQIVNGDSDMQSLNVSRLFKKCIYSIAWRIMARELYFPQENDFTESELEKFPIFLDLLRNDIESNIPKHDIHMIPCINKVLQKLELPIDKYFCHRSVNQGEVRVWDNWARLIIFIHVPYAIIVVELIDTYSDKWVGTKITDKEIFLIDSVERIPSFARKLIQYYHDQFLTNMRKISANQLNEIRRRCNLASRECGVRSDTNEKKI